MLRMNVPGRVRPLQASSSAADVETWTDEAVERLQRMKDSCSLDVAERGKLGPTATAAHLGVSKQRVDQQTAQAIGSAKAALIARGIAPCE